MDPDLSLEELKQRGVGKAAPQDLQALYRETFRDYGLRALWSSRAVEHPTIGDVLAITESLRVEGGVSGRRRAVQIIEACRAAL